jgi:hypothetical protein
LTESINSYLKCIRQYPCLLNQLKFDNSSDTNGIEKINDLNTFILFQLTYINRLTSNFITIKSLNESFLCIFNLLTDHLLLQNLTQRTNYSILVSYLIKDFYQILVGYFFGWSDENLIYTPQLSAKHNIDYSNKSKKITNDVLFGTSTLDLLLKLRYIITNYRSSTQSNVNSENNENNSGTSSMNSSFSANSITHRFLQNQVHSFRHKMPFNMRDLIERVYIGICRLPVLERFIRIPDMLWRMQG